MPVAQLNDINIYYEDHGSGFPVVFTHGFASASPSWQKQIEPLAQRYRVITWDIRGHGHTDSPEDQAAYNETLVVQDLHSLLQRLGIEQAAFAGHSLGGYLTLAFHLAHPEMVRALILADAGPGYRNPVTRAKWNHMTEKRALRLEERGLDALGRSPEVAAVRAWHRSPLGIARAARGIVAQIDARVIDSLPQVTVPTLIIVGERDAEYLSPTEYMARKIPNARRIVIPDAGHSPNLDQPDAFNAAILAFLDEVLAGDRGST